MMDEVEFVLLMGYNEFHIYDDLFNVKSAKVIVFCDEVECRGLKFVWDFCGWVNGVTCEFLVWVKCAGCCFIFFGVEMGTDVGFKCIKKVTIICKIREVFDWCCELGIRIVADYMIGFF